VSNSAPKKILVVPKSFFGDLILTGPVFEALKRDDPRCRISVVVPPQSAEFAKRDPYVDEVIVFDRKGEYAGWGGLRAFARKLRQEGFDRGYSFARSPRTALLLRLAGIRERIGYSDAYLSSLYSRRVKKTARLHEVVRNLELVYAELGEETRREVDGLTRVGPAVVSDLFSLRVPDIGSDEVSDLARECVSREGRFVVLSPGSAWETKRWRAEGFREVALGLVKRGYRVLVVGAPADSQVCERVCADVGDSSGDLVNLCAKTSLVDLVFLIKRAAGVICNDSLALHLASATKVATVVIFCATSPLFGFGPWKNRAAVVERKDLFCKPCRRHGSRRCPTGTEACMTGVSSSDVLGAFDDLVLADGGRREGGLHIV
jgi:heptosyltransferase-2